MSSAPSVRGVAAVICLLTASAVAGISAAGTRRAVAAAQIGQDVTALRVDGGLNEAIWRAATPVTGFIQREPREGAPATFGTEARVAVDPAGIYIEVRALDPEPDKILGFLTRRDV